MANPEHLKILKEGVDAWNGWRYGSRAMLPDPEVPNLSGADLHGTKLAEADLSDADLTGIDLIEADLRGAKLVQADLRKADGFNTKLIGANLDGAFLRESNLREANLRGASLRGTIFRNAKLLGADLRKADLSGADLTGATFFEANLRGANLVNANFTDSRIGDAVFGDSDLSMVKGLEAVQHLGPSTIGIDTIYRSKGNIPEVFLRGCGVPDDFIVYMRSLVGKAIDFYSCFISYSSKDDDFAQRLHADLQQKGVRCWFAPKDLKIGDKFRMRIDESIRIYDKLMVILSENSIRSPWVEEEVEAALEKERKQNKLVLFPIRLDDAVMETDQAWASNLRRTRHIGDFLTWKDHDPYQESFNRLLRDLKA
jgi:hypothetical protein